MIRHERVSSLLRLYDSDAPGHFDPYQAICTILWENDPKAVWMQGFKGQASRRALWELHDWLVSEGVHLVKAHRGAGHALPGGVLGADGVTTLDVLALKRRRAGR